MSLRKKEFEAVELKNPSTKFLEWSSPEKCFYYFDKEKKEKVLLEMPLKFITLKQMQTVKGYSEKLNGSIISNEVQILGKEDLIVNCYGKNAKGETTKTEIARGLYSSIKKLVNSLGGKYYISIYVMLSDGSLVNLQLKGGAVKRWGEFFYKERNFLSDHWISVSESLTEKKGANVYYTPIFDKKEIITAAQEIEADKLYTDLSEYLTMYLSKNKKEVESPENNEIDSDFIDF